MAQVHEAQGEQGQSQAFDAHRYWEQRLRAYPDITGVGYLGRSPRFVERQYHARLRQVERALRQHGLSDLAGRAALDIGAGSGIWLDFWRRHGAENITGIDFAEPSVERLRRDFPALRIVQADVSAATLPLPEGSRFDVISAFDVLLHVVDPAGFARAIGHLARLCAPGGWLIISDPIICGRHYTPTRAYAEHNTVRSLAEYRAALEAVGFTIQSIWPTTALLCNPLEAQSRLSYLALAAWWRATGAWGRSNAVSSLLGPAVEGVDGMLCGRTAGEDAPGPKLLIARRNDA